MKHTVKIFTLVFIVLMLSFTSCEQESVYLEDITVYDVKVLTMIADTAVHQTGIALLVPSDDFELEQTYSVSLTGPQNDLRWEKMLKPVKADKRIGLFFNDILMPPYRSFPSGLYTVEVFTDDASFIETSIEYKRKERDEKLSDINPRWIIEDNKTFFVFDMEGNHTCSVTFYDGQGNELAQMKTRENLTEVASMSPEEVRKILIVANDDSSSTVDVYRYIISD